MKLLLDKRILAAILGLVLAIGSVYNIDFVAKYGCWVAEALDVQNESCPAVAAALPQDVAPVAPIQPAE